MIKYINTTKELGEFFVDNEVVLVIFTQPSWCIPCIRLKPHLEAVSEKTEIPLVIIGEDADLDIAQNWNVMGVPMMFLRRGLTPVIPIESRTAPKILAEIEK